MTDAAKQNFNLYISRSRLAPLDGCCRKRGGGTGSGGCLGFIHVIKVRSLPLLRHARRAKLHAKHATAFAVTPSSRRGGIILVQGHESQIRRQEFTFYLNEL